MSIDRVAQLKTMHLFDMAAAWHEWQTEYTFQQQPVMPEVWLDRLIEAEQVDRQARCFAQFELPTQGRTLSHSS